MSKIDLDDMRSVEKIDTSRMLGLLEEFPRQCIQAADIGRLAGSHTVVDTETLENIVFLGMGGSGISGNIIKTLVDDVSPLPVIVNKSYNLSACVGKNSLVIAVSYSGGTEETLSAARAALDRGAQLICVTSGGPIGDMAKKGDLLHIMIPGGLQPRAAIGYLTLPILIVLGRLGLAPDPTGDIEEMLAVLDGERFKWGLSNPEAENEAKQLARALHDRVPIIYGANGLSGLAALRWKCQLNENSKIPAFWNILPELNHNEIMGWQELADLGRRFYLVSLRDSDEHPQISRRFTATRELIADHFAGDAEIISEGVSKLARFFSLAYLGDFVSVYLAVLYGIDPTPVERIQQLKARLAEE